MNLSKSGVGYSLGIPGFRVGTDAKGRRFTAASIPGTGLYNRTYSRKVPDVSETAENPQASRGSRQVWWIVAIALAVVWALLR
jgi:hypothetical protein